MAAGGAIDKICDLALDHRRSFGRRSQGDMHHLAGHIEADPQIGARQPQVEEGRGAGLEGREADEVAHHDLGLQTVHGGNLAARQHQVMLVHPRIEQEVIDRQMSR